MPIQTKQNMILTIAKKELTEMRRDGRYLWSAATVALLLIAALFIGWQTTTNDVRERDAVSKSERERWLNQDEKNPHSAAHYGMYAFKPKLLLSSVDKGTDAYTGTAVYLEAHVQNQFQYRAAAEATSLQRFSDLTAAVALQLLIPLLIVLLTFSAFTGEREQGTLRQLLSLGVAKSSLALGKALGVYAMLFLLLVPATLVGVFILFVGSGETLLWSRFVTLTLMYLFYFAILTAIGLSVSAFSRSSRAALIMLLALWFVQGFVMPRVMTDVGAMLYPTPSLKTFEARVREDIVNGIDGHNPADKRAKQLEKEILAKYGVDSLHKLPVNFNAIAMQMGEEHGNKVYDKHFGDLYDKFAAQSRVYQLGSLVAPSLAAQSISMSLAGTDVFHHQDFVRAAESHRRIVNKLMNEDMEKNSKTGDWDYKAGKTLWAKVPDFTYETPSLGWAVSNVTQSLFGLLFWGIASGALLTVAVVRLRVE